MAKVEFIYGKGGKKVLMARRYAETLRKLGHGTYVDDGYKTRMLTAQSVQEVEEPLVSEAVQAFAQENNIDITTVVGTGKDGRVKKADVEAAIDARDLI